MKWLCLELCLHCRHIVFALVVWYCRRCCYIYFFWPKCLSPWEFRNWLLVFYLSSKFKIATIHPRIFSNKLHSETQVSSRLGMSGGRSPRHAQNPLSGERRKTLSITHHALSPPPSYDHLYIISSHQLTTTFLSYCKVT